MATVESNNGPIDSLYSMSTESEIKKARARLSRYLEIICAVEAERREASTASQIDSSDGSHKIKERSNDPLKIN